MTGTGIYKDENKGFWLLSSFCCHVGVQTESAPEHTATPGAINNIGFYSFKGRHKIMSAGFAH